jgi:HK97 family phage prohead protease
MPEALEFTKVEQDRFTEWAYKAVSVPDRLKNLVPENAIYIEGLANTTEKDSDQEVIAASNWSKSIIDDYLKNPLLLYEHDRYTPVGKILEAEGVADGLFVRGYVTKSWPDHWKVAEQLIKGFSVRIKYDWENTKYEPETNTWYVAIKKLREISICSMPANEDSLFDLLKSQFGDGIKPNIMALTLKAIGEKLGFKFEKEPTQEEFITVATAALEAQKGLSLEDVGKLIDEKLKSSAQTAEYVSKSEFADLMSKIDGMATKFDELAGKKADKELGSGEGKGDKSDQLSDTEKSFGEKLGGITAKVEFKRTKQG